MGREGREGNCAVVNFPDKQWRSETVDVTRCGIAMVSPLYQLSPPLTKCKKVNA